MNHLVGEGDDKSQKDTVQRSLSVNKDGPREQAPDGVPTAEIPCVKASSIEVGRRPVTRVTVLRSDMALEPADVGDAGNQSCLISRNNHMFDKDLASAATVEAEEDAKLEERLNQLKG